MLTVLALVALGGALAESDPEQARRLLEKGLTLSNTLGIETAVHVTQATLIAARIDDRPLTLQLADRSIRHQQWGGLRPLLVSCPVEE
jgi:hypothetical protein